MKLFRIGGSFLVGVMVGAGAVIYAPAIKKLIAQYGRPMLKEIIKAGIQVAEDGRGVVEDAKSSAGKSGKQKTPE